MQGINYLEDDLEEDVDSEEEDSSEGERVDEVADPRGQLAQGRDGHARDVEQLVVGAVGRGRDPGVLVGQVGLDVHVEVLLEAEGGVGRGAGSGAGRGRLTAVLGGGLAGGEGEDGGGLGEGVHGIAVIGCWRGIEN